MIKGVIFDMDGVLFDTERLYRKIQAQIIAKAGLTIPEYIYDMMVGVTSNEIRVMFCEHLGKDFDFDQFEKDVENCMFTTTKNEGVPLKPFVAETLEYLKKASYPVAIASSSRSSTIRYFLSITGLEDYFDAIIGRDMVENAKPAPDCYLKAARSIGAAPERCIAIEDSAAGAKSSLSAGCVTVMIPDLLAPTDEMRSGCAAIFDSMEHLPEFIEKLEREYACGDRVHSAETI